MVARSVKVAGTCEQVDGFADQHVLIIFENTHTINVKFLPVLLALGWGSVPLPRKDDTEGCTERSSAFMASRLRVKYNTNLKVLHFEGRILPIDNVLF